MNRLTILAAATLMLTTGCYSLEPVAATPTPGSRVALAINDGGRVALGGSMGPAIGRVEGNLLNQQDSTYVVSVTGVNYLDGTFQKWAGETVRINRNMVSGLFEKKFSTGRTIVFVAVAVAAAAVIKPGYFKPSLEDEPPPPPPVESSIRPTRGIRLSIPR